MSVVIETTIAKAAPRAVDRLNQTVAALNQLLEQTVSDIQTLDSEYQEQLLEAVQQTEASLERQGSERTRRAVEEAEENMRALVTGELQTRFSSEMSSALEAAQKERQAEREQLNGQIEQLKQVLSERDAERSRLTAEYERLNQTLEQTKSEHERSAGEADEAAAMALETQVTTATSRLRAELTARWEKERTELTARWENERAHLVGERNRAQQRLADAAAEHEQQLAAELDSLRKQLENSAPPAAPAAPVPTGVFVDPEAIRSEATRIEGMIGEIAKLVEDPETELSVVIRKNVERAELESYLKGLRFNVKDA
jgi:DNA repair exonuclease SbcCD ATPase subunit